MIPHIDIDMLRRLAAERDFGRFFELAASAAAKVLGADGAALMQCIDGDMLQYRFFQGLPLGYQRLADGYTFAADQGTAGTALREGRPVFTPDYASSPNAMAVFADAGLRANLVVPVGPADDRQGVLAISWFDARRRKPREAEISVVLLVSDLIYGAMYRQSLEADLAQQARFDALTGLPNRRHLFDTLRGTLGRRHRGAGVAVALLDLNGFKAVNDVHGHGAGDQVLDQLARRLAEAVRGDDVAARLGGDEFALLLHDVPDRATLASLLQRLCRTLERRYLLDGGISVACPASIGAVLADGDGAELLLRHADQAMYAAKSRCFGERGGWEIFGAIDSAMELSASLPGAVEAHFQPVLDMHRGRVVRLEALARLRRDERLLNPVDFLPGLDRRQKRRLFDEVLVRALDGVRNWRGADGGHLGVSVNVEPETLVDRGFAAAVARAVAEAGVAPGQLTLEILERGEFLSQDIAREQLTELRQAGVRLAIDDLGSAYSSLLRLRSLPIDEIKMDQTFVREIASNLQDIAFVQSIQALANLLQVRLVVEGAESGDVLQILAILGVCEVQGYGVSRPVPAEVVQATIDRLDGWSMPAPQDVVAIAYARQQAVESHVLGLLRVAPERLSVEVLGRGGLIEPLESALRHIPEAWRLHQQQKVILHDMVRHQGLDIRLPMRRYRALGSSLRACLAQDVAERRRRKTLDERDENAQEIPIC